MQVKLCYFNQHWNIYLYTTDDSKYGEYDLWSNNPSIKTINADHGEYRLRQYLHPAGIPVFSYGLFAHDPKQRPGHGGEWSSNTNTINRVFSTTLLEAALDSIAVAFPITWLKDLLGDQVTWDTHDIYGHWITHVKGIAKPTYCQWVELKPQISIPIPA